MARYRTLKTACGYKNQWKLLFLWFDAEQSPWRGDKYHETQADAEAALEEIAAWDFKNVVVREI